MNFPFQINSKFNHDFIITDKVYQGFMDLFNDRNPLHANQVFAREKGFKGAVMHGNILNGFISYFTGECLPVKNVILHSQQIEYKSPVYLGDKLHFEATVVGVYESVNAVELKFVFKNIENKIVSKGKIQIGVLA